MADGKKRELQAFVFVGSRISAPVEELLRSLGPGIVFDVLKRAIEEDSLTEFERTLGLCDPLRPQPLGQTVRLFEDGGKPHDLGLRLRQSQLGEEELEG